MLKIITEIIKKIKNLYDLGGRCRKIRDVCMDFQTNFKVHNLVSVHPKSIILGQMTNLNMIFHVVVSVYRLVKIWNSPQFPDEFRNGQYHASKKKPLVPLGTDVKSSHVFKIKAVDSFLGMLGRLRVFVKYAL